MADQCSFAEAYRPFKNPNYRKNVNRRNKTAKQVISQERDRYDKLLRERRENEEGRMDVDGGEGGGREGEGPSRLRDWTACESFDVRDFSRMMFRDSERLR